MAYYNMIGKKMTGSGLSDILMEARLISSGSINGVLSGKNYNRATKWHKVMYESLHRLLIKEFLRQETAGSLRDCFDDEERTLWENLAANLNQENLHLLCTDEGASKIIDKYHCFCATVREGALGKTAQFWMSYIDQISIVLQLMRAVKSNDFELYVYSISKMCGVFFCYGAQNYARYATYFAMFLSNLEFSHPGAVEEVKLGVFSVARSLIPGNRCAVDKTMEETFMKHSKSKGGAGGVGAGLCGLDKNYSATQRWVRTTHERSKYLELTNYLADLI